MDDVKLIQLDALSGNASEALAAECLWLVLHHRLLHVLAAKAMAQT